MSVGAAGYLLKLAGDRREVFEDNVDERYFAEPVPEFAHSRHKPLVCLIEADPGWITHVAAASRGRLAGTDLRRLNLFDVQTLESPIRMSDVAERVPSTVRFWVNDRFENGGILPQRSFEAVADAIVELSPEAASLVRRFGRARRRRIESIPAPARKALGEQKEAVATALSIAGISRSQLQGWDLEASSARPPASYLDGLPQLRMREDQMLANDLAVLPGFDAIRHLPHPAVVFESGDTRLTVVLANRLPLEEQLGVDLIYYNETYGSFVMVQYKAMEKEVEAGTVFRLPNAQLAAEVARMSKVLAALAEAGASQGTDGYRLNSNPFYLKLCPRVVFEPDDESLVNGMYLPLDYWERLCEDDRTLGPRGGRYVSYDNATRYFDNTRFISLVADGWIGTNFGESAILDRIIREILETGRTVVLATESAR